MADVVVKIKTVACDRCGYVFKQDDPLFIVPKPDMVYVLGAGDGSGNLRRGFVAHRQSLVGRKVDLCGACFADLAVFLNVQP